MKAPDDASNTQSLDSSQVLFEVATNSTTTAHGSSKAHFCSHNVSKTNIQRRQVCAALPFLPGHDDKYKLPRAGDGGCGEWLEVAGCETSRELRCASFGRRAIP